MKQIKIFFIVSILIFGAIAASIGNTVPVADAGEDMNVSTALKVKLDGSASYDADKDRLTYSWSFLSQPEGSTATLSKTTAKKPKFTADANGTYIIQLIVNDGTVNSIPDTVTVQVGTVNTLPADITIDNAALQKAIGSIYDNTPYPIDVQGVIDASGLTVTVPYTVVNAPVTLTAYSTTFTIDSAHTEDDEAGIVATFAWAEQSLSVGTATFTATITIDDSAAGIPDDTYNAKKLDIQDDIAGVVAATFPYATDDAGGKGTLTLKIYPGIPDRMFGTVDNNRDANTHMFLYLPITNSTTGNTWLNNNLGANYTNINNPAFDIDQQATASADHNAYGSLFQWGRKADGHELITWTNGELGIGTNGTTDTNSDSPSDSLFITEAIPPYDWRVTQDNTLWASESSTNNVCPVGYRVPTGEELNVERQLWGSNDRAGALASTLVISTAGFRDNYRPGLVVNEGANGYYWASTSFAGESSDNLSFSVSNAFLAINGYRASGMSVRCIKD